MPSGRALLCASPSLPQAKELAEAWAAVLRKDKGAGKLLDAVPAAQRSLRLSLRQGAVPAPQEDLVGAAAVMSTAPRDAATLVDPDAWWIERRMLSRDLVDQGDIKTAYKVVDAHSAEKPDNIVDAEFHAGWYALRGLARCQGIGPPFCQDRGSRRRSDRRCRARITGWAAPPRRAAAATPRPTTE